MILTTDLFYQFYQKDYHKIKASYIKESLDNLDKETESPQFAGEMFELESVQRTLKSDLRQTYFHSIETFFELFFAFTPIEDTTLDPGDIMFKLANSRGSQTTDKIAQIAQLNESLNFLDEKINYLGYEITKGHYIFYPGIFSQASFPKKVFNRIEDSIDAIKLLIKIIATDFTNREEYNAYKHGLRLIPASSKLMIADVETMNVQFEWDTSDSMTFYLKTKKPNELKTVTKLFDVNRDYQMTVSCSQLIHSMIFYRRIMHRFDSDVNKFTQIPIAFFGKEAIEQSSKSNVIIQDIEHTISRTAKN